MSAREGPRSGKWRQVLVVALLLVLLTEGCQTARPPLFNANGPDWRVTQGQAVWRPRKGLPELAGDVVLAANTNSHSCLVQFSKTPMTLVSAQTTPTRWLIEFPPRRMSFGGSRRRPTRFVWLYLQDALLEKPLPSALQFLRKADGGWRLENIRTGEVVDGFLAP